VTWWDKNTRVSLFCVVPGRTNAYYLVPVAEYNMKRNYDFFFNNLYNNTIGITIRVSDRKGTS